MKTSVKLSKINKSYNEGVKKLDILSGVDVEFTHGKFSVLLGKSGSGKSSLLNLITGVDTPDSGDIIVGETNITKLSEHDRTIFRRRNIGIVFQFFNLIPTLTILENITLPCDLDGSPKKEVVEKAHYLLERVGLKERWKSIPDVLSGGEQQRVAIARALIHNPCLVVSDEPTGNLDTTTGSEVLNLLLELTRDANKTLIMATHSAEVVSHADFIYKIKNGNIVEEKK